MKAWPLLALVIVQGILFAAHLFIVHTWLAFFPDPAPVSVHALRIAVLALSFSFVASALLNFRHSNWFVSAFYTLASVWLGFANYFFLAACLTWPLWYLACARLAKAAIRWSGPYWPAFSSQWARWPASMG